MLSRNAGLLAAVSLRALIFLQPTFVSVAQCGTQPHLSATSSRCVLSGCSLATNPFWLGAKLYRGFVSGYDAALTQPSQWRQSEAFEAA